MSDLFPYREVVVVLVEKEFVELAKEALAKPSEKHGTMEFIEAGVLRQRLEECCDWVCQPVDPAWGTAFTLCTDREESDALHSLASQKTYSSSWSNWEKPPG